MFIFVAIFLVTILALYVLRLFQKKEKFNLAILLLLIFLGVISSAVFAMIGGTALEVAQGFLSEDQHQATVVDHKINYQGETETDYNEATQYLTVVEFADANGVTRRVDLSYSSSSPIAKGTTITVKYAEGDSTAVNLSLHKDLQVLILPLLAFALTSYVLIYLITWTAGFSTSWLQKIGFTVLLYVLMPLALLGFIIALGQVPWNFIIDENDDTSIGILAFCSFVALVLSLFLYGYLRALLAKDTVDDMGEEASEFDKFKRKLSRLVDSKPL